ncbi:MAG: LLM class flavin-dependent oxidoreductase [Betaproteobacteria bacterium]|nr:LLM class flavin-dependent oxidoreductase [Betaproteobacteria bacterium]
MTDPRREMHLAVFVVGTGNHSAGWRHEGAFDSNCSWAALESIAKTAERGKFDLFFVSDGLTSDADDQPSFVTRFEPTTLLGAVSMVTKKVGLGATVSTSFGEPFHVARIFASLDHLSGGRAAWNVVTTTNEKAALNFSTQPIPHDHRYEIAEEFVDVVRGLWDCWEAGTVVKNRETGVYIDKTKFHRLDHEGRFFSVRGPANIQRSPQGQPVIIHAGGSSPGQELAARVADVVFSVVAEPDSAKRAYDELKLRVARHGRNPEEVKILAGVMPIVGRTDAEAKAQLDRLQGWISDTTAVPLVSQRLGHDISGLPLDGPIPDFPRTERGQTFSKTLLEHARRHNMTLRDIYNLIAAAHGHWVICGTAERIADTLEEWFIERRADGYIVMPPFFPGPFDDFVDLVVPELQKRGLFRKDYSGKTLLEHLGIKR